MRLMFALMWKDEDKLSLVEEHLKNFYGDFIFQSETFQLPYSSYYTEEMGQSLFKKFVLTKFMTDELKLVGIKKHTDFIEKKFSINQNRTVNIDPIVIDKEKVVVATRKFRGNRIKVDKDVYLELELWYHNKSFQPFPWTYLDYKENIPFFNKAKKLLKR